MNSQSMLLDADSSPKQVWFTFRKEGTIINDTIVSEKNVSYVTKTIQGENALLFTVYIDRIIAGSPSDMVQFKYAWLIDESSAREIHSIG